VFRAGCLSGIAQAISEGFFGSHLGRDVGSLDWFFIVSFGHKG
jgi:hypothetical protein